MSTGEPADPGREAIVAALERHRVEYVVIGGAAAQARGWPEPTDDIDFTPERSEGNLLRLAAAVAELDAGFRVDRPVIQTATGHPTGSTGACFATRSRSLLRRATETLTSSCSPTGPKATRRSSPRRLARCFPALQSSCPWPRQR